MRIAVAGSIATDHLLTFAGRFADSILPEQLGHLSVSFLASDLQLRRGGTGANIAFALGALHQDPVLVGSVGKDAADYLAWLTDHGVDVSGVRTSEELATARFICTTDSEQNQIATFFPGAMTEATAIELAPIGEFDLVVIAPDDPGAMARHTTECLARGIPFAADPSQQLAFLEGPAIRQLIEGAAYLFTNEYEAGLVRQKTGWSDAEVLDVVGTRVTTLGAQGVRVSRQGEADVEVAVLATDVVEPTGIGDAFRGGFLAATAWGLGLERAAQVGSLMATHALEVDGPQEYVLDVPVALERFARAYGPAAADEVRPHLAA